MKPVPPVIKMGCVMPGKFMKLCDYPLQTCGLGPKINLAFGRALLVRSQAIPIFLPF
jgi:hypothetical protein